VIGPPENVKSCPPTPAPVPLISIELAVHAAPDNAHRVVMPVDGEIGRRVTFAPSVNLLLSPPQLIVLLTSQTFIGLPEPSHVSDSPARTCSQS